MSPELPMLVPVPEAPEPHVAGAAEAADAQAAEEPAPAPPARPVLERLKARNYARYLVSRLDRREIVPNTPLEVFLESANACNLNCQFCALRIKDPRPSGPSAVMAQEVMTRVRPWLSGLASMSLHGFGEPLINKHLLPTAGEAVAHGAQVDFFTNGMLLDEARAKALVAAGVPRITVSISSADPAEYARLYERGRLDRLVGNLLGLRREKDRLGTCKPEVRFNTIVMKSTLEGLPRLAALAGVLGVHAIDLKPLVTYGGLEAMHGERIHYEPSRDDPHLDAAREIGGRLGVHLNAGVYLATASEAGGDPAPATGHEWEDQQLRIARPCPLVYRTMYIRVDGEVKPCCFASDEPEWSMGNVRSQTPHEIWNGERYRALRRAHAEGRVPPTCTHCVKFGLAPQSDEASAWIERFGLPAWNADAFELAEQQFLQAARTYDAALGAGPGAGSTEVLRALIGLADGCDRLVAALREAEARFGLPPETAATLTAFREALAQAAKQLSVAVRTQPWPELARLIAQHLGGLGPEAQRLCATARAALSARAAALSAQSCLPPAC